MIQHPEIDTAIHCLDEMFESITRLYDQASRAGVDQTYVENFWKQALSWNERYMQAFTDLRSSKTQKEWTDRSRNIQCFGDEGFHLERDFRIWYDGTLGDLMASLDQRLAELDRKDAELKRDHPVAWYFLEYIFGPAFDGVDWLMTKLTKRGLYERVANSQNKS